MIINALMNGLAKKQILYSYIQVMQEGFHNFQLDRELVWHPHEEGSMSNLKHLKVSLTYCASRIWEQSGDDPENPYQEDRRPKAGRI